MRFGSREIVDVCFRAKGEMTLGNKHYYKDEPVLYFETLKTASLEGAATTVYATGGRGDNRLISWDGEKTLTLTFEDALLTPESFSILAGADMVEKTSYVHTTSTVSVKADETIVLDAIACYSGEVDGQPGYVETVVAAEDQIDMTGKGYYTKEDDDSYVAATVYDADTVYYKALAATDYKHDAADIFIMIMKDGEVVSEPCIPKKTGGVVYGDGTTTIKCAKVKAGDVVLVDYYVKRTHGVAQIEITPDKFGGNFYIEGSTLYRRESDGVDMPAEIVIPNGRVQSNFTIAMASSGDPGTFTFTVDAFPAATKFDPEKKVLAIMQIVMDKENASEGKRAYCG